MMKNLLYKITGPNGEATHADGFVWPLPNGKPGTWQHVKNDLVLCRNGFHACYDPLHIGDWYSRNNQRLWIAEYKGKVVHGDNKVVVRSLRLVEEIVDLDKIFRLFAADCAERALLRVSNPDARSVAAVEAARKFARGEITATELAAARVVAWDAARDAAWAAARAVAWDAAWDAARVVARDAARDAAARDAERDWQRQRLTAYLHGLSLAPVTLD